MLRTVVVAILAVCLFFSGAGSPRAQEQTSLPADDSRLTGELTEQDLIGYALRHNPSIMSARASLTAETERRRLATAYPDPQLLLSAFPEPIETRLGPQDWNLNLSQEIPYPGRLRKAGQLVDADIGIARLTVAKTIQNIIVAIRAAFHELIYIREAGKLAGDNLDLVEKAREVSEAAYLKNRTALLSIVRSHELASRLRNDLISLEDLEEAEKSRLNGLLGRPAEAPIGRLTGESFPALVYSQEEIRDLALENVEDLEIAGVRLDKAKTAEELAVFQNRPNFKVGLFYAGIGTPDVATLPAEAGRDAVGVQAGLSMPIWFGKNEARLAQSRAAAAAAGAARQAARDEILVEVRRKFIALQNSGRLMSLYEDELLPQAERSLEFARTWFEEGQGSFADFVEAQKVVYDMELALGRARADYGKALAQLERWAGRRLDHRQRIPLYDR